MSSFGLFGSKSVETRSDPLGNPNVSIADNIFYENWLGSEAKGFTGEAVNMDTALAVSSVWAAVHFLSDAIASLPLNLYKKTDEGRVKSDKDPLFRIIHSVVNDDLQTSYMWRKQTVVDFLLKGRGISFRETDKAGRPTNLWRLNPDWVNLQVDARGKVTYLYQPPYAKAVTYQRSEVIDLVWMYDEDGIHHVSPMKKLRNILGLTIGAERFGSILFEAGGVVPLVLNTNVNTPQAAMRAGNDINEALKRARDRKRNILVMPVGSELKPIGVDPDKLQTLDLRKFQVIEIARFFGIPPVFIQDLSTGTYSNTEQQDLNFVKHRLGQICQMFEQELNAKLFAAKTNGVRSVEFNVDGLLRGDFESRMAGYQAAVNSGVLTPDEAREMENRPAKEGGDLLFMQSGTVPVISLPGIAPEDPAVPSVPNPVTDPDEDEPSDPDTDPVAPDAPPPANPGTDDSSQ